LFQIKKQLQENNKLGFLRGEIFELHLSHFVGLLVLSPYKFDKRRGEAFIFASLSTYFIGFVSMKFSQ